MTNYVFGFGSLVDENRLLRFLGKDKFEAGEFFYDQLNGYRRCWNVAMDNRITIPDYKYYVEADTGQQPQVYVTFLNIRPDKESSVEGVLFKVDEKQLENLDERERNYARTEITQSLDSKPLGKVWTYIGKPEAEHRYKMGIEDGSAVISREYYDLVYEAYCSRGQKVANDYLSSTDEAKLPFMNLRLIRTYSGS